MANIITVNLKHLYQRRGLWLAYLIFGLVVFGSLAVGLNKPLLGKGRFMGPVLLQFLIGLCTASWTIEILTKPFSYCLPGHRAVPRKFVFSVAIVTSLLGSLLFLAYPGLYWWQPLLVTCSAFCAGLIVYWVGVGLAFGVRTSGWDVVFAFLLFWGTVHFELHIAAERAIIGHPFAVVLLGLASSAVVWIWLGNPSWARRFCAVPRIGLFDTWDRDKLLEYKGRRAAVKWDKFKNHPSPHAERFFLRRMNNCDYLGPGRYIWGGLYTTYGVALSQWKVILLGFLVWLAIMIWLSYIGLRGIDLLVFMGAASAVHRRLPLYSGMIILGGRKERFAAAIVLAGTIAALVTAVLALLATISMGLAPIMPEITLRGEELPFHAMSLRLLIVPSIIMPIALAFRLIIYRKPFSTLSWMMLVIALLIAFGSNSSERFRALMLISPTSLTSLLILGWLILVVVLRHVCMKRSLVGQART